MPEVKNFPRGLSGMTHNGDFARTVRPGKTSLKRFPTKDIHRLNLQGKLGEIISVDEKKAVGFEIKRTAGKKVQMLLRQKFRMIHAVGTERFPSAKIKPFLKKLVKARGYLEQHLIVVAEQRNQPAAGLKFK